MSRKAEVRVQVGGTSASLDMGPGGMGKERYGQKYGTERMPHPLRPRARTCAHVCGCAHSSASAHTSASPHISAYLVHRQKT